MNVGRSGDSGLFSMCLCCKGGGGKEEEKTPVGHSWCTTVQTSYLLLSQLTDFMVYLFERSRLAAMKQSGNINSVRVKAG
ncbi:hypothetical protein CRENBAI_010225 [Crenichthys baileyi]|uniref:Uncharacterized protein n=1 Tax=Crenichthys baileyi TaxID=28760 RepID=A0AAV9RK44_9TELE